MKKTRISKKMLNTFMRSFAVIKESNIGGMSDDCWFTKSDNSFVCLVGCEPDMKWLIKNGITESLSSAYGKDGSLSLGFNPEEKKWYGWSHRAAFGFGIGSKVKKGDCAFKPSNIEELKQSMISFWADEHSYSMGDEEFTEKTIDGTPSLVMTYTYNQKVPNKSARGTVFETATPIEFGKGEWTAKTLEDAKQMAIDFALSVS